MFVVWFPVWQCIVEIIVDFFFVPIKSSNPELQAPAGDECSLSSHLSQRAAAVKKNRCVEFVFSAAVTSFFFYVIKQLKW